MSPSYPPRRCAYKPCSNVLSRPKRETSRYCSFDCYMKNIANRPAPKRVHSNAVIIGALEGSKTISAAARSLGYNPENIYARAKRSPEIRLAMEAVRARSKSQIKRCKVCPNRVGKRSHTFCSMTCYWRHRRGEALSRAS